MAYAMFAYLVHISDRFDTYHGEIVFNELCSEWHLVNDVLHIRRVD